MLLLIAQSTVPASPPPTTTPLTTPATAVPASDPVTAEVSIDPTVLLEEVTEGCVEGEGFLCERVFDWTGNQEVADWTSFLLDKPLKIVLILLIAAVINRLVRRSIRRLGDRISGATRTSGRAADLVMSPQSYQRSAQRASTLSLVLRSVSSVFIWSIALMLVLAELGINLGPLIAGAGIAGVALGFGAQSLVKDFLSGFFMLLEDQFGVGDVVDVGDAVGTVENVTLRITTVRDINGTLWHVPNGEISRVGNKSQLWSRAVLDIAVAYDADLDRASAVIKQAADELWTEDEFGGAIKEEPELLGVERFDPDGITIRLTAKTEPASQFAVERELRLRIKRALEEAGIEIPFPQRTVWLRHDQGEEAEAAEGDPLRA